MIATEEFAAKYPEALTRLVKVLVQQAKAKLASDGAYRELAEKSAASTTETAAALADIRARLTAVEKILKDVE